MASPVLLKNRSELIRHALRKLKDPTTRKVQEYVMKHFGIHVSQPLVCHARSQFTTDPEDWRAERNNKLLRMLVNAFGGHDELIECVEFMRDNP